MLSVSDELAGTKNNTLRPDYSSNSSKSSLHCDAQYFLPNKILEKLYTLT